MKNQISHDSISRVEPSARVLSDQKAKIDAEASALNRTTSQENEEKEQL